MDKKTGGSTHGMLRSYRLYVFTHELNAEHIVTQELRNFEHDVLFVYDDIALPIVHKMLSIAEQLNYSKAIVSICPNLYELVACWVV